MVTPQRPSEKLGWKEWSGLHIYPTSIDFNAPEPSARACWSIDPEVPASSVASPHYYEDDGCVEREDARLAEAGRPCLCALESNLFGFGLRYSRHDDKGPDPTSCRYESSSWRIRSSGAGRWPRCGNQARRTRGVWKLPVDAAVVVLKAHLWLSSHRRWDR
jgi:hypothetical protein